jgi:TRAP-type C4-dicarboxylate transport system permease large subunit
MKDYAFLCPVLILSTITLTGCELIGDIFKAGVWVGVILVILVIAVIFWVVSKSRA